MVYVHLAEGFEEVEALTIVDVLRRAGTDVKTVSVSGSLTAHGVHGVDIMADILFEDADYGACEMIVLPGGMPGAANLRDHKGLEEQIRIFAEQGKWLAAICAAPMALASAGVLDGKQATVYPGMESHIPGAVPTGANVTVDGRIITGKGPALAMEFALALVEALKGEKVRNDVADGLLF